jgi:hypothetical protein
MMVYHKRANSPFLAEPKHLFKHRLSACATKNPAIEHIDNRKNSIYRDVPLRKSAVVWPTAMAVTIQANEVRFYARSLFDFDILGCFPDEPLGLFGDLRRLLGATLLFHH